MSRQRARDTAEQSALGTQMLGTASPVVFSPFLHVPRSFGRFSGSLAVTLSYRLCHGASSGSTSPEERGFIPYSSFFFAFTLNHILKTCSALPAAEEHAFCLALCRDPVLLSELSQGAFVGDVDEGMERTSSEFADTPAWVGVLICVRAGGSTEKSGPAGSMG